MYQTTVVFVQLALECLRCFSQPHLCPKPDKQQSRTMDHRRPGGANMHLSSCVILSSCISSDTISRAISCTNHDLATTTAFTFLALYCFFKAQIVICNSCVRGNTFFKLFSLFPYFCLYYPMNSVVIIVTYPGDLRLSSITIFFPFVNLFPQHRSYSARIETTAQQSPIRVCHVQKHDFTRGC